MTAPLTATHRIRPVGPLHVVERRVTGSALGHAALWQEIHSARSHLAATRFAMIAIRRFAERHPGAVARFDTPEPEPELERRSA